MKGMGEIQILSKQIDFNNLIYYFKGKSASRHFLDFRGPLALYRNINNGYITLEKAEENQKNFKLEDQKSTIKKY